ncbi:MAG: hypothetical protein R3F34_12980 [Planctomycetota bacterium]
MIESDAKLEFVFARERARQGRGDVEAFAQVRVVVEREGLRSRYRDGGVRTLGEAVDPWPLEPFPQVFDAAVARHAPSGTPTVWMSAELQSWFAKRAPETFRRLLHEANLYQRDPCYAIVREGESVRLAWRPRGAVRSDARPAPLFDAAHAVAQGRLPGSPSGRTPRGASHDDALRLLRAHLVAHHLTHRLPAEVEWLPQGRSYRLRGADRGVFLREGEDGGRGSVQFLGDGFDDPFEVDVAAPLDVPAAVVRRGLEWLLAGEGRSDGELYLDPTAEHVHELW